MLGVCLAWRSASGGKKIPDTPGNQAEVCLFATKRGCGDQSGVLWGSLFLFPCPALAPSLGVTSLSFSVSSSAMTTGRPNPHCIFAKEAQESSYLLPTSGFLWRWRDQWLRAQTKPQSEGIHVGKMELWPASRACMRAHCSAQLGLTCLLFDYLFLLSFVWACWIWLPFIL